MTPELAKAILTVSAGYRDQAEFCRTYDATPDMLAEASNTLLRQAIETANPAYLDNTLALAERFVWPKFPDSRLAVYRELLVLDWHCLHEDMISYLQQHPAAENIPVLLRAIALKPRLGYLDYDDYGAYYKRCLWALQVIPDRGAYAAIQACTTADDPELRAAAHYRLSRIAK